MSGGFRRRSDLCDVLLSKRFEKLIKTINENLILPDIRARARQFIYIHIFSTSYG